MAECLTPFIRKTDEMQQPLPCGQCPNCTARRISAWSFRLMQESKRSTSAYFITLTYDTEHVPISKNGFMELRKTDPQKWFKKLRKHQWAKGNIEPLKYYLAGEYGDKYKRPHYHVILFNLDLSLFINEREYNQVKAGNIPLDGKYNFTTKEWQHGHVTIGQVTEASVGYTLIYINKKWKPMHRNDDRQPNFSLMSKKMGLNYLSHDMVQWYKADLENRMYCNLTDGKKISMPRYYKDKLYMMIFQDEAIAEKVRHDVGQKTLEKMNAKKQILTDAEQLDKDFRTLAKFQRQELKHISKNF